jgi:hypothetical protein
LRCVVPASCVSERLHLCPKKGHGEREDYSDQRYRDYELDEGETFPIASRIV